MSLRVPTPPSDDPPQQREVRPTLNIILLLPTSAPLSEDLGPMRDISRLKCPPAALYPGMEASRTAASFTSTKVHQDHKHQ